ncbi:MAG: methionine--tRNA ligase [Phycisphaerae bacterium]|nr:methionine--tRNA ligase [Phycisphaerae bacterium]
MGETYYVTTPIYYVNDVPHIGHSYTTIAADVLARYFRAEGRDVHFLTGTDEHGIKIAKSAADKNKTPQALADEVVVGFKDLWRDLNISNDDFIRTTDPRHEKRVQHLIQRLVDRGDVYLGKYEGYYDESQEEFVTESAARENDYKSVISGKPLARYSEPTYLFRLGKWVPKLVEHIEANPNFVLPKSRRNEVLSKLAQGVGDLSISRSKQKLPWGIAMPNDRTHVVYVWIDALSNYYTALGLPEVGDAHDGQYAKYWPCDVHLIGKDILWFHTVYWPCMLLALDIPLPRCIFAHGWWMSEGKRMQKTLGNFISRETIAEICEEYSRDFYRYFLLRAVAFGSDGDFSRGALLTRYNTELANGVGNLLSRTVAMIGRYFDGAIPPVGQVTDAETPVVAAASDLQAAATPAMEICAFHTYLDKVVTLVAATDKYIDTTEPFKLAKDQRQRDRLGTILYTCVEAVRIVLLYLGPVMPESAETGLKQLGWQPDDRPLSDLGRWGAIIPGAKIGQAQPLFPRKR